MSEVSTATVDVGELTGPVRGPVSVPGDEGYDAGRSAFQTAAWHRPDVVVSATGPADVRAAVAFAASRGLPVAVQATGHGMPPAARGGLLVDTSRMTGVRVDPETGSAWLAAGVRWDQVIHEAAPYGLAPLSGSAGHVGAVSYTLGGGVGLLSRRYGYAADHVRAVEVVTPDARTRRVTAESEPDLFWALRGGRSNFGVVTGIEIDLLPVARLYGGGLYFAAHLIPEVLAAWRELTATAPEELGSSVAMIPFPDLDAVPAALRGRLLAHVRVAFLGTAARAERLLAPLRAIGPEPAGGLRDMPYRDSGSIHSEPPVPMPYHASHALLPELDDAALDAVLEVAGPDAPRPQIAELRHLGGAMARPPAVPNAVGHRNARYVASMLSAVDSSGLEAVRPLHRRFRAALEPRGLGSCLNFLYGERAGVEQVRTAYEPRDYRRLAELKARYDPDNLFRLNHNIPPA
ncbi:FAD-binding oxidoreductase [Amycolatopsis cihanbeyliensis]|uniref:FAD/FMN-containing dehydrogenase n=1 Tax=Amycolatopsis cihanbeyliensis TaxID=1128664 RepID=A0A542DQX9_AMYCI|nr:FAD-binding oxidoreductase [Amycolatopsis cihanbeyliensis]TQJ05512.1 FAD/FMN-containing dehydrogenase [Amycolatopsis cihanbeyliensis]